MVRLVIKAPLTDSQGGSIILHLYNPKILKVSSDGGTPGKRSQPLHSTLMLGGRRSSHTDLLDHLQELLLLVLLKCPVVLYRGNIQLMLSLGLWGLKRTGEDSDFCVFQNLKAEMTSN